MKAIVWTEYGTPDGLQLREVSKPIPKDDEVLIKIRATSVTAGDAEMRKLDLPLMLSFPMRLYVGLEFPRFGRQVIWLRSAISEGVSKYHFASENATTAILVHVFSRSD